MNDGIRELVEKIWRYHQLDHELSVADAILVLCSHDRAVAERAAQVFLEGFAPLLIFSGGLGGITQRFWSEPEAEQFAKIAVSMGGPGERILVENRSSNTGENVLFTYVRGELRSRQAGGNPDERDHRSERCGPSESGGPETRLAEHEKGHEPRSNGEELPRVAGVPDNVGPRSARFRLRRTFTVLRRGKLIAETLQGTFQTVRCVASRTRTRSRRRIGCANVALGATL